LHDVDEHSSDARTVKAALCCGFYPQVWLCTGRGEVTPEGCAVTMGGLSCF
jgi:hypothetical protein